MSTSTRVTIAILCSVGGFLILMGIGIVAGYRMRQRYSAAQETAAIQEIRGIQQAETHHFAEFGKYATDFEQLGDSIPAAVAEGKSGGYLFTLATRPGGYEMHVDPDGPDNGAGRRFYSDETLVIRVKDTIAVPATEKSPELK